MINSTILLENKNDILPLHKDLYQNILIIGSQAYEKIIIHGLGSGEVIPSYILPPLWAICDEYDIKRITLYNQKECNQQTNTCITYKKDDSNIQEIYHLTLVFISCTSTEGIDRFHLSFNEEEDQVIFNLSQSKYIQKIIVNMVSPGVILTPWTNVIDGLILNILPGEAYAEALQAILFGYANPSAKLSFTLPNKENEQNFTKAQYPGINYITTYNEKLLNGYRYYDYYQLQPKYEFGYGLSYTKFQYKLINIDHHQITLTIKNVGNRSGAEIIQLYIGYHKYLKLQQPVKVLKGFKKVYLQINQMKHIVFQLDQDDLSLYDINTHQWKYMKNEKIDIYIAASSRDIRITTTITI